MDLDDFKIKAMTKLIVGLVLGGAACLITTQCSTKEYPQEQATPTDADKLFNENEHIIAEEIVNPTDEIQQYPYHKGYKPVGITTTKYDNSLDVTVDHSYIIYENVVPIRVAPTMEYDQYVEYKNFGYPVTPLDVNTEDDIYNIYEHIVSIPYSGDVDQIQFEYHDGYEIVGVCNYKDEGCILYVNTEPVEVKHHGTKDDKIEYDTFGTIIEEQKTKQK